jgi:hypothetical protein
LNEIEEVGMQFPFELTTGYTVELGLNISNELSFGVAWNYFGQAEYSPERRSQLSISNPDSTIGLENLIFQRRIQTLEVKLGYTIRYRDNR